MQFGKVPGSNGFSIERYQKQKVVWAPTELRTLPLLLFSEIYTTVFQKWIRTLQIFWLFLLDMNAKTLIATLVHKLQKRLPLIINPSQTGFMKG